MTNTHTKADTAQENVLVVNPTAASSVVLVCEHASHFMPTAFDHLGLLGAHRTSHAAWDPGALQLAKHMSKRLDAVLVAGGVSRLIYDCNRPPDAPDAMPMRSEVIDVPGNQRLSQADRDARVATFYTPFREALQNTILKTAQPVLITIHSFTPVYHGETRDVEIGILHDSDTRLADVMLGQATAHTDARVKRNAPYGPEHGVTHTLKEHGLKHGHLNAMLEIRNDLIETSDQQMQMAEVLSAWIAKACAELGVQGAAQ